MNYLQIILDGFANPTTRNFLIEYFRREFIKAKEKHFEHLEFFEGCQLVINSFKEEIDRQYYDRKRELSLILSLRNEDKKETADIEEEKKSWKKDCCSVNLHQATKGNYFGTLWYNEIIEIEIALRHAHISIVKNLINEIEKPIIQQNIIEIDLPEDKKNVDQHPDFNPSLWNEPCFNLFKYLKDNYHTKSKRQITNIWFFLKEYKPSQYNLKATKDKYKEFIIKNYSIEISNFDKAQAKYEDTEFQTMNDWRIKFEDTLK